MEEDINTLLTTGLLFKNDRNSLFIRNLANTQTKNQENLFDDLEHSIVDGTFENENISTSTLGEYM